MDRIPLINPKLIKVSAAAERAPESVLRAEVVSSTPTKKPDLSQAQAHHPKSDQQQDYKVVLKVGGQQLETISNSDFKKGSILDIKLLPGPALKIINSSLQPQPSQPVETSSANVFAQQLLADRIPKIQQQELPNLIKQLSQIINPNASGSKQPTAPPSLEPKLTGLLQASALNSTLASEHKTSSMPLGHHPMKSEGLLTNQQTLANLAYSQQSQSQRIPSDQPNVLNTTTNTASSTALQQVKTWLHQLPKEYDISNATGLRNALSNAGPHAEKQLSQLAQQFLTLANKKNANTIFQQLQTLHNASLKALDTTTPQSNSSANNNERLQTDLASIIKRTAKALSDNSQTLFSGLTHGKSQHSATSQTGGITSDIGATSANQSNPAPSQWQNPLLNNSALSLEDLLKAPLLQNPSSNTKFALSQILTGQNDQTEGSFKIPLNWPERSGSDAALIRNLQNILGHIEREQVQQMQSSDANQSNNPSLLQQNQQWIPLLINQQQQLQLIEFYMDKEERLNEAGEKKNHWFINLHFNLPKLGQLGIEIAMIDNECNTTFWSESKSTLHQLSHHIQPLRQRLTEQGIIVTDIQPRHGTLEKRKNNIQQRLVDVKT